MRTGAPGGTSQPEAARVRTAARQLHNERGAGRGRFGPGGVDTGLTETIEVAGVDKAGKAGKRFQKAHAHFKKRAVTSNHAARAILRGVKRNRYMVYTSPDIFLIFTLQRAFGSLAGRSMDTQPPQVFLVLGRTKRLFWGWLMFAGGLMPGGKLPRRETELIILRVATLCAVTSTNVAPSSSCC